MNKWFRRGTLAGIAAASLAAALAINDSPSVVNGNFAIHDTAAYVLSGAARGQLLGDAKRDLSPWGVALRSTQASGSVSQLVPIHASAGRRYRFSIYAMPEDGFTVQNDSLILRVDFLADNGSKSFDSKTKSIYPQVTQARNDLGVNGKHRVGGAAVWTTYALDFAVPFDEVDQVRLSVAFDHGSGRAGNRDGSGADFDVAKLELTPIATTQPGELKTSSASAASPIPMTHLLPLGGRWFYAADEGDTTVPSTFNAANATRLLYHDDRYTAPFAGMMTSTLKAGEKDRNGRIATEDQPIDDEVIVHFTSNALVMHTRGLPNHPTGRFPEAGFGRGFNPSYIQEQDETFYIPLNPAVNPRHLITDTTNANHALPMGPIGIAMNGIVFFNPFDMGNTDATDLMDRCCGHPNQMGQYHYHKYPICINSPWSDHGDSHSGLLGFAFDGFPIYGPYEEKGVMAKDETGEKALNGFNMHYDAERGWHYHVTPGKFPYIIGGYWGTEDSRDQHGPPRRGGSGGPGQAGGLGGGAGMGGNGVNRGVPPGPPPF